MFNYLKSKLSYSTRNKISEKIEDVFGYGLIVIHYNQLVVNKIKNIFKKEKQTKTFLLHEEGDWTIIEEFVA